MDDDGELVLECVYEAVVDAKSRLMVRSVSRHARRVLRPSRGTLSTLHQIHLSKRVLRAWKGHRTVRNFSWVRRRVRNDETPILQIFL